MYVPQSPPLPYTCPVLRCGLWPSTNAAHVQRCVLHLLGQEEGRVEELQVIEGDVSELPVDLPRQR